MIRDDICCVRSKAVRKSRAIKNNLKVELTTGVSSATFKFGGARIQMQGAGVMRESIMFRTDDAVLRRRTATAEEHRQKGAFFEAKGQQQSIIWTVSASKKKYKIMLHLCIHVMDPRH